MMEVLAGADVPRLKLGVRGEGRGGRELADYVLEPFGEAERSRAREMVELAAKAVSMVHREGIVKSMNEFNGRLVGGTSDLEEDQD